jgi:hypothetical protein
MEVEEEVDVSEWINLYNKYSNNTYSSSENDRKFTALTGVPLQVAEFIYIKYRRDPHLSNRFRLFLVLIYLKLNPVEDVACSR